MSFMSIVGFSQSPLGGSAGAFSRVGQDAFSMSLGNAVVAYPGSFSSAWFNPALPSVQRRHFYQFSSFSLGLDRQLLSIYGTKEVGPLASMSGGILYASSGSIEGRNIHGEKTTTFTVTEAIGMFNFSMHLRNTNLYFGVNMKWLYADIFKDVPSSTSWGLDLGAVYAKKEAPWMIGFSILNMNSSYRWNTKSIYFENGNERIDNFPLRMRLGGSYNLSDYSLKLLGEIEKWSLKSESDKFEDSGEFARVGAEWTPISDFSFRIGLDRIDFTYNMQSIPSFGFSYVRKIADISTQFDFSYSISQSGPQNLWSASIGFSF